MKRRVRQSRGGRSVYCHHPGHALPQLAGLLSAGWAERKGSVMGRYESFTQYAADCVRQAESQQTPGDKDILLNVALAWVRLAQQSQAAKAADTEVAGKPVLTVVPTTPAQPAAPPAA
jgi:hypothetical protein